MALTILGSILAVHLVAMISPGPNFFVVTQTSVTRSRREGVLSALGVAAAAALWSGAAVLGVSLLFETTAWLYAVVKVLGGAYLIYLGLRSWRRAGMLLAAPAQVRTPPSGWRAFRVGFTTNLTNPQSVVFFGSIFAALLPAGSPVWLRAAAVGVVVFNALWWHLTLALAFSTRRVQGVYGALKRPLDYLLGGVLVLLGARLVLSRP